MRFFFSASGFKKIPLPGLLKLSCLHETTYAACQAHVKARGGDRASKRKDMLGNQKPEAEKAQ